MKWGYPNLLHLLWLLPLIAWVLFYRLRRREKIIAGLVDPALHTAMLPGRIPRRPRTRLLLFLFALALLIIALARPQWGYHLETVKRRGLDILVLLDTSNSMLATDIKPNRLQQAKWGIRDLVQRLQGDRIGLIAFAGTSYLQCPLTTDYPAFNMILDDIYPGIIPRGGTDIASALQLALQSFEKTPTRDSAIILITDGEDHSGQVEKLIPQLAAQEIRVYALGAATLDGELIPLTEPDGQTRFLKNNQGSVVKTALQEGLLEKLALQTKGIYIRFSPGNFGFDRLINEGLANLKRDEFQSETIKTYQERFAWFLLPALLLLAIETTLPSRRSPSQEKRS